MKAGRIPWNKQFTSPRRDLPHLLGSHAQVLLTSVFGPYAQDDEYGSHQPRTGCLDAAPVIPYTSRRRQNRRVG